MAEQALAGRVELTRRVIGLLDNWGVKDADQVKLLALPTSTRGRMMRRYRQDTPFPDSEETMERIRHLFGIAEALRTTYPVNPAAGAMWMRKPNQRFGNRAPVTVLTEDGMDGLLTLRSHLDCSFDWDLDAKRKPR